MINNILLKISLALLVCIQAIACSQTPSDSNESAAYALASRVMPSQSSKIVFKTAPADTADYFILEQKGGKIQISGNNANSMAVGLNHYLKYYCHVEYGWLLGDSFSLPSSLPKVEAPVKVYARVKDRFFLNYCTYGYTMPWWGWKDWEHFIDWMALNGVNLPLAITGQESIWYQIWTEMGLTDEEVRGYFTGPAHLPWHRMQNIDRWFSPLPKVWLDGQLELQKEITARERELNMKPVLPAFSGHVPAELARLYPDAPMTKLDAWSGYSEDYACTFLDPMSDLYTEIQKKFVEKETEIYGTDHIYGIDLFNELTPPSWEPEYLSRVSKQVYESLKSADPDATWLQMGWLFYNERKDWTNERIEAYLTSFPKDKQVLLDYYCDRQEVWKLTESFFGVPYIWCYLGNFGGNTFLVGDFKTIQSRLEEAFKDGGKNFTGIGSTLEGFDCNPYIYEYVLEQAWNEDENKDLSSWIDALADQRIGHESELGRKAWKTLSDSVYVSFSRPGQSPVLNSRPNIGRTKEYYARADYFYNNRILLDILSDLLSKDGKNSAYGFDLTNITRQMLSNYFGSLKDKYDAAYAEKDREEMKTISSEMLEVIDDIDRMISTQSYFLVGKWISDARAWGNTEEEKTYFERNARNLITTWSDADMDLNDYAARTWAGLTGTLYKGRWEIFFRHVESALDKGETFDDSHYDIYNKEVTSFEKKWWDECVGEYPSSPVGDSKAVAKELFEKYMDRI